MVLLWKVSSILFCLTLSKFGLISCVLYVENGKSLILNPDMKGTPEDILWTFNGNKLAEQDLNELQVYGRFVKRTEIDFSTGRLRVHRMTRDDSGVYKVMIQINGKLQYYTVDVEVLGGVPEPQVTCELNSSSQSRQLFCSMTDENIVTYTWTGPNVLQSGQTLEIDKDESSESVYICTVKNPVSQSTNSIILKDCITDGLNLLLIVPLVTIVVILIVGASALVIYFRCWRNKRKQMSSEGAEGMRLLNSPVKLNEDVNQRSLNVRDVEQNREQKINEDEDLCEHNNEGEITRSQDTESNTDENISEQKKEEDVESEPEQSHESDVRDGAQDREQQVNEDEGTLRNEGAVVRIQEDDENISEQKKDGVESEPEQSHESANDCNQSIRDDDEDRKQIMSEQREDLEEEDLEEEDLEEEDLEEEDLEEEDLEEEDLEEEDLVEGNTDEGADEKITEKSEDVSTPSSDSGAQTCVKELKKIFENP